VAALPGMLENGRKRAGWSVGQAAWHLGVSIREYRETRGWRPLSELRYVGSDLQALRLAADVHQGPCMIGVIQSCWRGPRRYDVAQSGAASGPCSVSKAAAAGRAAYWLGDTSAG
jgi:hypothetical protein